MMPVNFKFFVHCFFIGASGMSLYLYETHHLDRCAVDAVWIILVAMFIEMVDYDNE